VVRFHHSALDRERKTPVDLNRLLDAWALPEPRTCTPLAHGTNNLVQRVEAPSGSYVLRVYSNHTDAARLRFEHAVLAQVHAMGLPFAVPAPIPARAGESCVRVAPEDGENGETLATLTTLIPGEYPRGDAVEQACVAGEALGLLDAALTRVVPPDPAEAVSWRSYGDLAHCHPLVPDPLAAIMELSVADEVRQRLLQRCAWLLEHIGEVYARLPQQLVHEDYAPSNILMDGLRVMGVLDFEFCARDVRAMELTVALSWWPVEQFGTGEEWPIIRAFVRGYARHIVLTPGEIAAIPTLFELRGYTSLIHRLGRHLQGLSPLRAVTARATAALERADWLAANGARFVEEIRRK
jgi:homoserine kinase type II